MNRRRFLRTAGGAGVGALAGIAGCVAPTRTDDGGSTPTTADSRGNRRVSSVAGVDLPVPREEITVTMASIRAIVDPAFGLDWRGVDWERLEGDPPRLRPEDPVIGLVQDGVARAYPLRVLGLHEVVNDTFPDGTPVLVTYCPICDSGVAARRVVDGTSTEFTVSGLLWKANLLMLDGATGSLWSQVAMTAVRRDLTGTALELVPATFASWGEWRADHPATEVLLPPPESRTQYGSGPPAFRYRFSDTFGPPDETDPGELHSFTHVIGVVDGDAARAYPRPVVRNEGVVIDRVGSLPVVVALAPGDNLVAYDRRVDGETLRPTLGDERHLSAGGSRWLIATGEAVDGPHEGTKLRRATAIPEMTWRTWRSFHPETTVYGAEPSG